MELPLIKKKKKIVVDCAPRNSSPGPNILLRDYIRAGARTTFFPSKTCKRCKSSTRTQKNKDIWDLSNIGLNEKIQLFGRRESKSREERKIEAGHRTSLLHKHFFLRIFIQMFLLVYSTIKIRDTQCLLLHLQPWKDHLKSFQCCLRRLQSQLVILPCKIAGTENGRRRKR